MTGELSRTVETIDAGTHNYVIGETTSGSKRYRVVVSGQDGAYSIEAIPYLSDAREIGSAAPPPVPGLDGATLAAGKVEGAWYVFAPGEEQAASLETRKLYALTELASLTPTEAAPLPDIRIVAREETGRSFEEAVYVPFGRIITTYGINLSDDTYHDRAAFFLENEAEIIDDEKGMDVIAAQAGYDSYTQFQYDDAGEPVISMSLYEIDNMDWVDVIDLPPQIAVEFALETSEKARDDMLREVFQEYKVNGLPEAVFEGGRRSPDEIRRAATTGTSLES